MIGLVHLLSIDIALAMVLLVCAPSSAVALAPAIYIDLLNPPKDGLLELAVGESYTFDIVVTSEESFTLALAISSPGPNVVHGCLKDGQMTAPPGQFTGGAASYLTTGGQANRRPSIRECWR